MNRHHHVYVIKDMEFCKIGHSGDPEDRLRDIMVGSPRAVVLARRYRFPDRAAAIAVEHEAHRLLAEAWVRGEWFRVEPDDACRAVVIGANIAGHFSFRDFDRITIADGCVAVKSKCSLIDRERRGLRRDWALEHYGNANGNER